ncbi:MAG: 4-alpha-glucanotransferase [Alteromonadaceae bacterium]|jgi:4-alpha-glucanotransferase
MTLLNQLAALVGIQAGYTDAAGQSVQTSDRSRDAILSAMGFTLDDEQQTQQDIIRLRDSQWLEVLAPVKIIKAEDDQYSIDFTVNLADMDVSSELIQWQVTTEDNQQHSSQQNLSALELVGQKTIDDQQYNRYRLNMMTLAQGYHDLSVSLAGQKYPCRLIVAPQTCYGPKDAADFKMWGLAAQLYSLKKEGGWGIGDYGDLSTLVDKAASVGASVIGLNPLHPLYPGNPAHRSPYSPTSRCFLNSLYIDVTKVDNFDDCKAAQKVVNSDEFKTRLAELDNAELIDYAATAQCKYQVLELLYEHFHRNQVKKDTSLGQAFADFKTKMSDDLYTFATFDALYEHFRKKDFNAYSWTNWPLTYHDPKSEAVAKFQLRNKRRVDYFMYLQWLADSQLGAAAEQAKQSKMAIGLYLDLAVGCDGGGAEVWADKDAYVSGAAVGAPPDQLNSMGQNWGLTPINPVALKAKAYLPLISALRSNMRYAGALRIDHVFGLMRQYWVGPGLAATEGAFVTFPLDDILRIIALESRRASCVVVGEDLGTTPDGFGEIMAQSGLLSYRVLYFERWQSGLFQRPENYPEQSMVTVSTHDMPTLVGWWTGKDLDWREQLNLYPQVEMAQQERDNRVTSREMLLDALRDANVLSTDQQPLTSPPQANPQLTQAVQAFLAKSPGRIQLIPLEDAIGLQEQVNIPGTIDEHPNWLQRLPHTMEEFWQNEGLNDLMDVMQRERPLGV